MFWENTCHESNKTDSSDIRLDMYACNPKKMNRVSYLSCDSSKDAKQAGQNASNINKQAYFISLASRIMLVYRLGYTHVQNNPEKLISIVHPGQSVLTTRLKYNTDP